VNEANARNGRHSVGVGYPDGLLWQIQSFVPMRAGFRLALRLGGMTIWAPIVGRFIPGDESCSVIPAKTGIQSALAVTTCISLGDTLRFCLSGNTTLNF
jgi:hypothetical protein